MLLKRISIASLVLVLALAGGAAADLALNAGALMNAVSGRASVEEACLPELKRGLAERGFLPSEVEFAAHAKAGLFSGPSRSFSSGFTFEDGPQALRVDGIMACVVDRDDDVHVDFRTAARPLRAT